MSARKLLIASLLLITSLACRFLFPNWEDPPTILPPLLESSCQFENEQFSFTIPAGWLTMEELWDLPQEIGRDYYGLGVGEIIMITNAKVQADGTYSTYFAVASSPLAGGTDLDTRFHQTYDPLIPDLREVSQQKFDSGALSGLEITYQRPWGEPWWQFRDIWIERNAVIYVLSFHGSPNDFETYKDDFELILQSFNFR